MNTSFRLFVFVIFTFIYEANADDLAATTATPSIETIIQIPQGKLEGTQQTARNGRPYAAFLGIPYGKAGRFEESVFADSWNGTRDATKFGENCLQYDPIIEKKIVGVETCLFLNVYTPNPTNVSKTQQLPVMVFIHGGGFQFWSGRLGNGKYFMSEDVVLVSFNYRLGPFGFLKTPIGANFGMKDQVLALKWVQQNIEYFGGDKNSVTIFGESAGAASVSFHIVSPLSKGLFHRAISQSGVANSPFAMVFDPARELRKLGILMDCPTSNQEYLMQCLKKIDGNYMLQRIETANQISISRNKTKEFRSEDIPYFVLSVDADTPGNAFLPDTPYNLMQKGDFAKVPWMAGVNAHEGIFFPPTALAIVGRKSWNAKDSSTLKFDEDDCKDLAAIREYYIGGDKKNDQKEVSANITDLLSDRFFNHPTKVASIFHAKYAPAYLYHFSLKGTYSFVGDKNPSDENGLKRPAHGDEMQYQFQIGKIFPDVTPDSKYGAFSEFFIKLWVSFAKDGTVNPEKLSPSASAWTPVSSTAGVKDDISWYELDNESKMTKESLFFNSRLNFWNDLLGIK